MNIGAKDKINEQSKNEYFERGKKKENRNKNVQIPTINSIKISREKKGRKDPPLLLAISGEIER